MHRIHKGRLAMLVIAFVSAVAMTVGIWWNGTNDPFVAVTLVVLTLVAWAPFGFHIAEAFHYVEGWTWDCGYYTKVIEHYGRSITAWVEYRRGTGRWHVVLREVRHDRNGELLDIDFWSERYLHEALTSAYNQAISVIINDEELNSPF